MPSADPKIQDNNTHIKKGWHFSSFEPLVIFGMFILMSRVDFSSTNPLLTLLVWLALLFYFIQLRKEIKSGEAAKPITLSITARRVMWVIYALSVLLLIVYSDWSDPITLFLNFLFICLVIISGIGLLFNSGKAKQRP